tara:strand:+ start:439 stop:681 length:243 start_codon:yes stop_codon:yes gene_type:complete
VALDSSFFALLTQIYLNSHERILWKKIMLCQQSLSAKAMPVPAKLAEKFPRQQHGTSQLQRLKVWSHECTAKPVFESKCC